MRTARADDLLAQERTDPALVESDLAVSLDPLSTGALLDRATILQLLGRPKDAAADVRRALRLEPANADTWAQAADLQRGQWHDPKGACTSAQTAHALAPFNTSMAATAIEYVLLLLGCRQHAACAAQVSRGSRARVGTLSGARLLVIVGALIT